MIKEKHQNNNLNDNNFEAQQEKKSIKILLTNKNINLKDNAPKLKKNFSMHHRICQKDDSFE